ncbi:MAG: hypothetical protein HY984_00590 [Candidatus Magasanikbacteria bacterium]|nr:hypothetical protein [Candidatus Magasanikbacteria bacterium]
MNLKDFAAEYGISALARRHFGYRKPVSDAELGGYAMRGALTYMRALERSRLGLTHEEAAKAYAQGRQLVELGIVPAIVIVGDDQRNLDGGLATAEGIKAVGGPSPAVRTSPAVTYPHYGDFATVRSALAADEDFAVHRYLATGLPMLLWSEPPAVFELRITAAILADYGVAPVLFDLNFEQVTLLKFLHVDGLARTAIPFAKGAWCPKMGGGIVYSADRQVVREFLPDLTIAE